MPGPVGSPGSTRTWDRCPDEVGADRLAGDAATGRHHDPRHLGRDRRDLDRAEAPRCEVLADLLDRRHALELLERRARRQPHRDLARGHRRQSGGRRQPGVAGHLVAFERDARAGRQLGREEPCIEPPRKGRRRDPARQWHQPVGVQAQVELRGDRPERCRHRRRAPIELRRPSEPGVPSHRGRRPQQHARLLEQLADGRDIRRERIERCEVSADRRLGVRGRQDGSAQQVGRRVRGIHPTSGEDVHSGGERHRRRALRQQDVEPARSRSQQDHRRSRVRERRARPRGGFSHRRPAPRAVREGRRRR